MNQYSFNQEEEYKIYKTILKSENQCYLNWKKRFITRYSKVENQDFFINFIKWLELCKRNEKYKLEKNKSISLPFNVLMLSILLTFASLLMSGQQWKDDIKIRADSLLNNGVEADMNSIYESEKARQIAFNFVYLIIIAAFFSAVSCYFISSNLATTNMRKIDFYCDCQQIIEEEFLIHHRQ